MLNSIGLREPRHRPVPGRVAARVGAPWHPDLGLGRGLFRAGLRRPLRASRQARRGGGDRAEPLVSRTSRRRTVASTELVAVARSATAKPLYAKLSPALPDVAAVAVAVERAGADGLTLVNTIRGLSLDEKTLRRRLATSTGGLSGPALRPVALAAVHACYTVVGAPDRRGRRRRVRAPCTGADRSRSLGRRPRHDPLPGARSACPGPRRAGFRAGLHRPLRCRRGARHLACARRCAVASIDKKTCKTSKMVRLEPGRGGARMPRHAGFQDAGAGPSQIARPAHGGTAQGE